MTRAASAAQAASRRAVAADALLSNGDCWQVIGQAVLRTHDLKTHASWRRTSRACLDIWKQNFDVLAPWLSFFPTCLALAMWSWSLSNGAEQVADPSTPEPWKSAANGLIAQFMRARLKVARPDNDEDDDEEEKEEDEEACVPRAMAATPTLADFRLHVAWCFDKELFFVGTAKLDECLTGLYFFLDNLVDVFGGNVARLVPENTIADGGLEGLADVFWNPFRPTSFVFAMLTRSDGAMACLATGGGSCTRVLSDEFEFDFEDCVASCLEPPTDDNDSGVTGMNLSLTFTLDEVTEYGPKHAKWNERMREQYEEVRKEQREESSDEWGSDDGDPDSDMEDDALDLEDVSAIVPASVGVCFLQSHPSPDIEERTVAALMRLVWV